MVKTEIKSANLRPAIKHGGGSVNIWGSMASVGVGNLVLTDKIMDRNVYYLGVLRSNLHVSTKKLYLLDYLQYSRS